ncbi:MAG: CRTAC1 family protein [Thiobacillaceae bacterium]|nr:CRTAC1 family protein [Thiobacillaceae bacterium]
MNWQPSSRFARHAAALVALLTVLALYGMARPQRPPADEQAALAERFRFTRLDLPRPAGFFERDTRPVHPSMARISAWVSAMGAGAALGDVDGDGLPNDLCHVEPRSDQVQVLPVPGTGARYAPFLLTAAPLSFDASMAPMGCLVADLNEDGATDFLVYYWGRTPLAFLRRTGDPAPGRPDRDAYLATEVMPAVERWYSNAATLADLDGDGHLDLVIGNTYPDGSPLLDAEASGVMVMPESTSRSANGGWNRLLLWAGAESGARPSVRYRDESKALREEDARGWTLAVAAGDLDGDLLPELYFANDFGSDRLLHNRSAPGRLRFEALRGEGGFTTPKSFVVGQDSCKGMGADLVDVNGDGLMDIYVSNISSRWSLQEGHFLWLSTGRPERMRDGVAPYVQGAERLGLSRSGWGWDAKLADFDNDGVLEAIQATGFIKGRVNRWPELQALGTANDALLRDPRNWPKFQPGDDISGHDPNAFFVRDSSGKYFDIAARIGLGDPMVTRGVAIADVDGDGDLDFVFANQWQDSYFYRNDSVNRRAFLGLDLRLPNGAGGDRPAIGALASVLLPDGRRLAALVDGGNGIAGKRDPRLHFGLGDLPGGQALKVEIRWRDTQGQTRVRALTLPPGWHRVVLG